MLAVDEEDVAEELRNRPRLFTFARTILHRYERHSYYKLEIKFSVIYYAPLTTWPEALYSRSVKGLIGVEFNLYIFIEPFAVHTNKRHSQCD